MTNDEFVNMVAQTLFKINNSQKNLEFQTNPEQMEKFVKLLDFFTKEAGEIERLGGIGRIDEASVEPRNRDGILTVTITILDVSGERLELLSDLWDYCSELHIGVHREFLTEEKIDDYISVKITMRVPDVYIPKTKQGE